ncbi:unnamed protein product [Toxocara canis]|uniref:Secreted protein n=1 Tax=Toxocara canis TaxID=6265 RepID=A0A183USE5_TOXCA|nr:unnamed protein product [Toxocara canis]
MMLTFKASWLIMVGHWLRAIDSSKTETTSKSPARGSERRCPEVKLSGRQMLTFLSKINESGALYVAQGRSLGRQLPAEVSKNHTMSYNATFNAVLSWIALPTKTDGADLRFPFYNSTSKMELICVFQLNVQLIQVTQFNGEVITIIQLYSDLYYPSQRLTDLDNQAS